MGLTLRWYQQEAVEAGTAAIEAGESGGIILPTGSGKSVVIGGLINACAKKNMRTWVLTHSLELIEHGARAIERAAGVNCGIVSASIGRDDSWAPVMIGGVATIARRLRSMPVPNLIIVDESHRIDLSAENGQYARVLDHAPDAPLITLTATPWRHKVGYIYDNDGRLGRTIYSAIDYQSIGRMVGDGYLSPLINAAPDIQIDTSAVKTVAGDFEAASLGKSVVQRLPSIIAHALQAAQSCRRCLLYTPSLDSADMAVVLLRSHGETAHVIHGELQIDERRRRLAEHRSGNVRWLVSVGVLTTGYDDPAVDCLVIARPTKSTVLHVQIIGRGMRPHPDKTPCLVLDYSGNIERLGPVDDPVPPRKRGKNEGPGMAPTRRCIQRPQCEAVMHVSVTTCPACGAEQPPPDKGRELRTHASTARVMRAHAPVSADDLRLIRWGAFRPVVVLREGAQIRRTNDGIEFVVCKTLGAGSIQMTPSRLAAIGVTASRPTDIIAALPDAAPMCLKLSENGRESVCGWPDRNALYGPCHHPIIGREIQTSITGRQPRITRADSDVLGEKQNRLLATIAGYSHIIKKALDNRNMTYVEWLSSIRKPLTNGNN